MRRRRAIYFNDARHHYLFVHEPPMRLEDARGPVDEVAGTTVDTFSYGVSRDDGLFYPSRVGLRFGADKDSFDMAARGAGRFCRAGAVPGAVPVFHPGFGHAH